MICPVCETENEKEPKYCNECGWEFIYFLSEPTESEKQLFQVKIKAFQKKFFQQPAVSSNKELVQTILSNLDKSLKDDKEFILDLVRKKGWALQYASERLKSDKEVVLEAVNRTKWSIKFANKKLKKDKVFLNSISNTRSKF